MESDIRDGFGVGLSRLVESGLDVVALVSDSKGSAKLAEFEKRYPDRLFDVGIAEQNMVGMAAGLAACGRVVFVSAITNFVAMRAFEPFRTLVCHAGLNVKMAAMSAGLAYPYLGASHVALEDLAMMRAIPGLVVLYPADNAEAAAAVEAAGRHEGPVYLRFGRQCARQLSSIDEPFHIGKSRLLREGRDVALVAAGPMVAIAIDAADRLGAKGLTVAVVNMSSIKPLDAAALKAIGQHVSVVVTIEEHTVCGGLGSAVAEVLAATPGSARLISLGVPDAFSVPGQRNQVLEHFGLDPDQIAERVAALFQTAHR